MADIVPGNGEFLLYPNIPPMLLAGSYTLTAEQSVTASGKTEAQLPVDNMDVHIEVRSPRLVLPPDQVLSTFPPAESEGPYGSRLPQVVIRRRTLPWERKVEGAPVATIPPAPALPKTVVPWLALVVVAEGEATLVPNVPAVSAITPGVTLKGAIDADVANCLEIRQSMVKKIFPTQKDVPLLAHARHVDIADTELMMGDDDGFLAVVVANRLPVPGRDADGNAIPVNYTACLVNLEGQWAELLPTAPAPKLTSNFFGKDIHVALSAASMDKHVMGAEIPISGKVSTTAISPSRAIANTSTRFLPDVKRDTAAATQTKGQAGFSTTTTKTGIQKGEVAGVLATEMIGTSVVVAVDRLLRFPVLLHWRFTTRDAKDFQRLMQDLDSGLLGTKGKEEPKDKGRLPLELVDTGHVGIEQKTRRGDSVRAWYRGPFVPHPTEDDIRLALAHAADQLRIVIPDGREDLSLASAFEIGRLLALANPNMVAALLRWRQLHYVTVRRGVVFKENKGLLDALHAVDLTKRIGASAATDLSRAVMRSVSTAPKDFLGQPRPLVEPGRKLPLAGDPATVMAAAFGLPALNGTKAAVLTTLQKTPVRVSPVVSKVTLEASGLEATVLTKTLDKTLDRIVVDTTTIGVRPVVGAVRGKARAARTESDALDEVIDRLTRAARGEPEE